MGWTPPSSGVQHLHFGTSMPSGGVHPIRTVSIHPIPRLRKLLWLRPKRHDEVGDLHLHGFAILIERRRAHLDHTLRRTRLRRANLRHLALDMQLVARPHGPRPTELVKAGADDAAHGLEVALDLESPGLSG